MKIKRIKFKDKFFRRKIVISSFSSVISKLDFDLFACSGIQKTDDFSKFLNEFLIRSTENMKETLEIGEVEYDATDKLISFTFENFTSNFLIEVLVENAKNSSYEELKNILKAKKEGKFYVEVFFIEIGKEVYRFLVYGDF